MEFHKSRLWRPTTESELRQLGLARHRETTQTLAQQICAQNLTQLSRTTHLPNPPNMYDVDRVPEPFLTALAQRRPRFMSRLNLLGHVPLVRCCPALPANELQAGRSLRCGAIDPLLAVARPTRSGYGQSWPEVVAPRRQSDPDIASFGYHTARIGDAWPALCLRCFPDHDATSKLFREPS